MSKLANVYQSDQLLEKTLSYEQQFAMNSYQGNVDVERPFMSHHGKIPIVISAPHATEHFREGDIKKADIYTGSLALLLYEFTDAHVIYSTKINDEDPNYVIGGDYKAALQNIIKANSIKYVIDLHGSSANPSFSIDLGTNNNKLMDFSKASLIKEKFEKNGIANVKINHTFSGTHPGTS